MDLLLYLGMSLNMLLYRLICGIPSTDFMSRSKSITEYMQQLQLLSGAAIVLCCLVGIARTLLYRKFSALVGRRAFRSSILLIPRVNTSTAQRLALSVVATSFGMPTLSILWLMPGNNTPLFYKVQAYLNLPQNTVVGLGATLRRSLEEVLYQLYE